ncbi:response regulator [Jiella mangrovi]|nr:response regulator [Jiella mangrovi]
MIMINTVSMLTELGHATVDAMSGEEALQILAARDGEAFDLVITDHSMPRMTGIELAMIVRDRWPSIAIIVASGYSEDVIGSVEVASAHLHKPFGMRELDATIQTIRKDGSKAFEMSGAGARGGVRA